MAAASDPVDVESRLATFYDQEGDSRLVREPDPRRVGARTEFLSRLAATRPATVLEIGPGPGLDARSFVAAGHRHVGADLSMEHARRCADGGSRAVVATARQLPFRAHGFDALWTMSALMHVPDAAIDSALSELSRVLRPGGIGAIGVWGGEDQEEEVADDRHPASPPRLFSRRSRARWTAMLAAWFAVEDVTVWESGEAGHFYQLARVRGGLG